MAAKKTPEPEAPAPVRIVEGAPAVTAPPAPQQRLDQTVPGGRYGRADGTWHDANGNTIE